MKIRINTLLFTISGFLHFFQLNAVGRHTVYRLGTQEIYLLVDDTGRVTNADYFGNKVPKKDFYVNNNYLIRFVKAEDLIFVAYINKNGSLLGVQAPIQRDPDATVWYIVYKGLHFRLKVNLHTELPEEINLVPKNIPIHQTTSKLAKVAAIPFYVFRDPGGRIVAASLNEHKYY